MENKKQKGKKRTGLIIAVVVTVLAVLYIAAAVFFRSHFCFGTTLDGMKVGGYNVKKTEQLIKREVENYSLKLTGREGGSEVIVGNSLKVTPVFNGEIEKLIKEQNAFAWIVTLFKGQELQLEKTVEFEEEALESVLKELSFMKPENQRTPVNAAYSEYIENEGYVLIPADYGTTIDTEALKEAVKEAVCGLLEELNLDESACYVEPEIGDDNEQLLALIEKLNSYAGVTITYDFGEKTEVLDGAISSEWFSDEDLELVVDEEKVLSYVKSLAKEYNTAYRPKELETSYGTTVTISNGHYGWKIDNAGEVEQILADLEAGTDVKREPVYAQRANSHGENDYGDSYVEINLTAQHLFLYANGNLVVESDFVSGDVAKGHSSPTGAFGLTYKTRDAVLRGEDYATPVKYWMPFAGDVGMHDASWRRSFGGGIYLTNGSHGCINLPGSVAKTIYETIDKGYPVLVYKLPGTESEAVKQQEAANVVNLINSIGTVTLESEPVITSARNLYDALPESAKGYVTNYDMLPAAEAALAQLKAAQPPSEPVQ